MNYQSCGDGKYFPGFIIPFGSKRFLTLYMVWSVNSSLIRGMYLCLYCPKPCSADIEPFLLATSCTMPSSIISDNLGSLSKTPGDTMLQWRLPSEMSNKATTSNNIVVESTYLINQWGIKLQINSFGWLSFGTRLTYYVTPINTTEVMTDSRSSRNILQENFDVTNERCKITRRKRYIVFVNKAWLQGTWWEIIQSSKRMMKNKTKVAITKRTYLSQQKPGCTIPEHSKSLPSDQDFEPSLRLSQGPLRTILPERIQVFPCRGHSLNHEFRSECCRVHYQYFVLLRIEWMGESIERVPKRPNP